MTRVALTELMHLSTASLLRRVSVGRSRRRVDVYAQHRCDQIIFFFLLGFFIPFIVARVLSQAEPLLHQSFTIVVRAEVFTWLSFTFVGRRVLWWQKSVFLSYTYVLCLSHGLWCALDWEQLLRHIELEGFRRIGSFIVVSKQLIVCVQ